MCHIFFIKVSYILYSCIIIPWSMYQKKVLYYIVLFVSCIRVLYILDQCIIYSVERIMYHVFILNHVSVYDTSLVNVSCIVYHVSCIMYHVSLFYSVWIYPLSYIMYPALMYHQYFLHPDSCINVSCIMYHVSCLRLYMFVWKKLSCCLRFS